jgi:hypothetical protein
VLAACARLPVLKCLYLKGNPMVSSMRSYRKATIAAIPTLTYLDERPVFEVERLSAEGWCVIVRLCAALASVCTTVEQQADNSQLGAHACRARGGVEAEREARAAYHTRQLDAERQRVAALQELREAGWKKRVSRRTGHVGTGLWGNVEPCK